MSYQANDLFDLLPMDDNASENGSKPSSNNVDPQEGSQTLQQVAEDHDAKKSKVKSEIEDIFDGLYWASLSLE